MQAKFLKATSSVALYEVKGTSSELDAYEASITAQGRTVQYKTERKDGPVVNDANGRPIPLYFTPFPMPSKTQWYDLTVIQSGKNKGNYTLDTSELAFDKLLSKSFGQDLGEHISAQLATKHTGVSLGSKAPKATSITLTDDEDDDLTAETDATAEPASESADMESLAEPTVEATAEPKAKNGK